MTKYWIRSYRNVFQYFVEPQFEMFLKFNQNTQIIICKQSKICNDCEKELSENVKEIQIPTEIVDVKTICSSHILNVLKRVVRWANARSLLESLSDRRYKELSSRFDFHEKLSKNKKKTISWKLSKYVDWRRMICGRYKLKRRLNQKRI